MPVIVFAAALTHRPRGLLTNMASPCKRKSRAGRITAVDVNPTSCRSNAIGPRCGLLRASARRFSIRGDFFSVHAKNFAAEPTFNQRQA